MIAARQSTPLRKVGGDVSWRGSYCSNPAGQEGSAGTGRAWFYGSAAARRRTQLDAVNYLRPATFCEFNPGAIAPTVPA
jgi:hypothetical protein